MPLCHICEERIGKIHCFRFDTDICSSCCGINRSWHKCPTTCRRFKKEEYPVDCLRVYGASAKNKEGEIVRGIQNCFVPNVYEIINCNVKNLNFKFLNSSTLEINILMVLNAPRNVVEEIYLKDEWKKEENWGPYTDFHNLYPLFFVFTGKHSKFYPFKTRISLDGKELQHKESNLHWNVGLPLSTIRLELGRPFIEKGEKKIEEIQFIDGKAFTGHNLSIFSEFELNKPIEITSRLSYQNLSFNSQLKMFSFPLSILFPFKKVNFEKIEVIPPNGFLIEDTNLKICSPKNSVQNKRYFTNPINMDHFESGHCYITAFSDKMHINDYDLLKFDLVLKPRIKEEAITFVTSYPIPSSIYNSINKLYPEKFSPVKVIISNFSDSTLKYSIISKINCLSNKFEKDIMVGPLKQEELKIMPNLDLDVVNELKTPLETSISTKILSDSEVILRDDEPVTILARDTMMWEVDDPGRSWAIDLSNLVVSWITPQATEVDKIISSAAILNGSLGSFGTDLLKMDREIKSIYDTISEDIRYVNRPFSFGTDENVFTQRIFTPSQTINGNAGNCIDLTVLFASCLESIGINPLIAIVPKHAFIGWKIDSSSVQFLESTYLGRYSYAEAKNEGNDQYEKYFSDGQSGTKIIDVKKIRAKKVYPPPWF